MGLYIYYTFGLERYYRFAGTHDGDRRCFDFDDTFTYEYMVSHGLLDAEKLEVTTLEGLKSITDKEILSENAYNFLWNLLSGESGIPEYNSVVISDFTLSNYEPNERWTFYIDFTVTESGLDALPSGKYHRIIRDIRECYLCDPNEDNSDPFPDVEEVKMLRCWIISRLIWNCPTFGEYQGYEWINNYLCNYYGRPICMLPLDEYIELAAEKFGVTDGGIWLCCEVLEDSPYEPYGLSTHK